MVKHIVVPIDGSSHALKALASAKELALSLKEAPKLTVLHVNPAVAINEPPLGVDLDQRIAEEGVQVLESVDKLLEDLPGGYERIVYHGDPGKLICKVAKEQGADLIVMGTRGLNLMKEMLLGSVSHYVLQHAGCPVMTIR